MDKGRGAMMACYVVLFTKATGRLWATIRKMMLPSTDVILVPDLAQPPCPKPT